MLDIYKNLNPEQLKAVQKTEGPTMIIAGPGSGKTRVITEKIAYLIKKGVVAENILALTFTNKAAKEMRERILKITNNQSSLAIWMGTFHSIFAKILRKEAYSIGYTQNFTIYDNDDSIKVIRRIIKDRNLDKEIYNPKHVFSKISILKNNLINSKTYYDQTELIKKDELQKRPLFKNIYQEYSEICKQSNSMDFDDLLLNTFRLFERKKEVLEKYQSTFKYVLIDEYQDTNKVQDKIVKQITSKQNNICIVGDDSQSIYSFRGANINNMLLFEKYYKDVAKFKLEQNYRSTKNIVNIANALISNNKQKIDKTIFTNKEEGDRIQLKKFYNDREEGDKISEIIYKSIISKQTRKSHHTILYRTNSQSKVIEDGLRKRSISYKVFGGLSFYQRKEVKDVMAYLKLILNKNDEASLLRIINYPSRGIGATTVDKIRTKAKEEKVSFWDILNSTKIDTVQLTNSSKNKVIFFRDMINSFVEKINANIFTLTEDIMKKTGIIENLKEDPSTENINKLENISELLNSIKIFSLRPNNNSLLDFINEVSLDETKDQKIQQNKEYVSLMTIHQSKGLEFNNVYIVGVEDGLFPSKKSIKSLKDIEEERRLFYVAITRAIKKITISYVLNRFQFGTTIESKKSIFLEEIDQYLDKEKNIPYERTIKIKSKPENNFHYQKLKKIKSKPENNFHYQKLKKINKVFFKDNRNLTAGQKISHNIFGFGEIKIVDNSDGNEKITVDFKNKGTKVLLTKFAKFEIIT